MISTSISPVTARAGWLARTVAVLFAVTMLAQSAFAVERVLKIEAPAEATANGEVRFTVRASTDAGANERVGFFHIESSTDGGKTWVGQCFEQNMGASAARLFIVKAGAAGTKTMLRARVAFRGGKAGDVDYTGAAIKWQESWTNWGEPPTRIATVEIK